MIFCPRRPPLTWKQRAKFWAWRWLGHKFFPFKLSFPTIKKKYPTLNRKKYPTRDHHDIVSTQPMKE